MTLIRDSWTLPASCRILIAGAGLAGLETASALEHQQSRDVIVLDAGPANDLRHINAACEPREALRAWLDYESDPHFHRSWTSASSPHYQEGSGLRRRVGGRSLYWHGVILPIEPWALTSPWPAAVVTDLSTTWREGDSLYDRVRQDLQSWQFAGGERLKEQPTASIPSIAGCHLQPTPRAVRPSATHAGRWLAYSPLDRWRDAETNAVLREPDGMAIHAGVEVVKVLIKDGAARGVLVRTDRGEMKTVMADAVVLAAGTVENSRLAIQALAEAGSRVTRLGGLVDHIVQGLFVRLPPVPGNRLRDRIAPGSYWAPCKEARSNLFLALEPLANGDLLVDLQMTGEQLPSPSSCVECTPSETSPWRVLVRTATSADDQQVIDAQRRLLQHGWDDLAEASRCGPTTLAFDDYNRPQRTNALLLEGVPLSSPVTWSSCLGTEDHEGGTLGLGVVLDEHHEFAAIPNLFAAGPSTFPRSGAANPGLTLLALARRLAGALAERV